MKVFQAYLIVASEEDRAAFFDKKILGLNLCERMRNILGRARIERVDVLHNTQKIPRIPSLIIRPESLCQPEALSEWLKTNRVTPGQSVELCPGIQLIFPVRTGKIPEQTKQRGLDSKHWSSVKDIREIRKWLLGGLTKDTEGFMSKRFERKISLFFSRYLSETNITPNQMTIFSVCIGLIGAVFFISLERIYHVWGALFFWLSSVLDGCDGEIARLKFMESRWGGILDYWGDNVVHAVVFSLMGVGLWRAGGKIYLSLGIYSAVVALLCAAFIFWRTMRKKKEKGPLFTSVAKEGTNMSWLVKLTDALARRDFIYLVLILSAIGHLEWFLIASAVGSTLYLFSILYINLSSRVRIS